MLWKTFILVEPKERRKSTFANSARRSGASPQHGAAGDLAMFVVLLVLTRKKHRSKSESGGENMKHSSNGEEYEDPLTGMTSYEYDERLESNLNTEASMVVLDVVEDFIKLFEPSFKLQMLKHAQVMEKFLKLLLEFTKRTQSNAFLDKYYGTLRSFVDRFPVYLFQYKSPNNNMNPCGPLTLVMVKQLVSNSYTIRSQASALLYLMMKRNFENRSNFNRMRVETTVALTKLLDTNGIQDDTNYRKGLGAILRYAELDFPDAANVFRVGLKELMDRLFRLLEYSVQLTREKDDPEMQADLYHSIALDYKNAPELRVAWLESLSHRHSENESYAEAAHCWVHISALVAQYLAVKGAIDLTVTSNNKRLFCFVCFNLFLCPTKGADALSIVTPNAVEEAEFFHPDANADEEVFVVCFVYVVLFKKYFDRAFTIAERSRKTFLLIF
jgi:hypothetical protein